MAATRCADPLAPTVVADVLRRAYGLRAEATPLPGERDQNFAIVADGGECYVLKVHADDADPDALSFQNAALAHVRRRDPTLPLPYLVPTRYGVETLRVPQADGAARLVRLLTWVPGDPWARTAPRDEQLMASLGGLLARLDRALADFSHPRMRRPYPWDMQRALDLRDALALVGDPARREAAARVFDRFERAVLPRLRGCRTQVIHNDASEHNVLVSADGRACGLIDFGDLVHGPLVCDLAVACAYAALGEPRPVQAILPLLAAYHEGNPLTAAELELLFDLIRTRLAMSICMAARQHRDAPANEYLLVSQDAVWELLQRLDGENAHLAHFSFRDACGLRPSPTEPAVVRWLEARAGQIAAVCRHDLRRAPLVIFDLSAAGDDAAALAALPDVAAQTDHLFHRMRQQGAAVGIGRYREPRLFYDTPAFLVPGSDERRTVHMGIDLFVPPGEPVHAPLDGVVHAFADNAREGDYGPVIILEHRTDDGTPFWTLYGHLSRASLEGLAVGRRVVRGEAFAQVGDFPANGNWPPHLHFQLLTHTLDLGCAVDGVAALRALDVWESVSPDPNLLLGIPQPHAAQVERDRGYLLAKRRLHVSRALSLSYDEPLRLTRGEGQFLYDDAGNALLDLVNNVCHVGHCHPRVVRAGQEQLARLNTNTRYLYDPLIRYARRLVATFPEPLNVCFLVNSGSEANDLALRLARAYTGAHDVLVLDHAYHGHLTSLVEISPYKFNGPGGAGCPTYVQVCELPDGYRGRFTARDSECGVRYAQDVARQVRRVAEGGRGLAAFFAESAPGCAGQIILPPGYLTEAYRQVRAAGGVCVADEVQTGLGRVGSSMWAFETQGVVPDIVTLGKPLGNGHPLGAVVTTPTIAAAFATGMEYFNTFGGNPVSCAIGLAVLDVIRDERLQAHALETGGHLLTGLRRVQQRHALIGDVRGLGLFIGVELVRDRNSLEPAAEEAARVVEAMKARGILLSIDGPHHNVLKIKPPLAITGEDCDRVVAALDDALRS